MPWSTELIRFAGVTRVYAMGPAPGRAPRVVTALKDVDLVLPAGGVHGVVGPNGAGKTTLIAVLLGFIPPTRGEVQIHGQPPGRYVRRTGAGYLPERFQLPGEWSVRATLRALARLEGLSRGRARARADAAMERLGLADHAAKPLATLSRGLLQRVGIAQALLGERELVVLDEPTEGLDPLWRIRFRAIVEEIRNGGRTVLMASHDLSEVERLATGVVLLEQGRVVRTLEPAARAPDEGALRRYRLVLAGRVPAALAEIFPGAVPAGEGAPGAHLVEVDDAVELSTRLAALLAAGATVEAVEPMAESLEERVRRALSEPGSGSRP